MSKVYDFITTKYSEGEPIFLSELKELPYSDVTLRQEVKAIADGNKLKRIRGGVYIIPYKDIFGLDGSMSISSYIDKKYLYSGNKQIGYITGLQLANEYGFTTQVPATYEVCSNAATTRQRKDVINSMQILVYRPLSTINNQNASALQFLDLMSKIDKYAEIKGDELKAKIKRYIKYTQVDFDVVKQYLPLYPDRTFRNLYYGGVLNKLT